MREIIQQGDPVLRKTARALTPEECKSSEIKGLISDMSEALSTEKYGVAIAAPQVGESIQLFVVAGKAFAARLGEKFDPEVHKDKVFINPRIISSSKKRREMQEGCLSVRGFWGNVKRSEKVTIEYLDHNGDLQTTGASGFMAQIFQHEIDHLHGVLYVDIAHDVWTDEEHDYGEEEQRD